MTWTLNPAVSQSVQEGEFLQRSEVRIGIGAHIVEQINFLDRVFR